jgi:hypothetical protein
VFLLLHPSAVPHAQAREKANGYAPLYHTFAYGPNAHYPDILECCRCVYTYISLADICGASYGRNIRIHSCDFIRVRGMGVHWQLHVGSRSGTNVG